ncbi:MAG: acetyltransferase [Omnitrophica bacterium RIFCSPHIGHO2_02_FULL_46_11]|nr:MAG: acetyltransferase [Omnitrophica bacterium RIFCSPHIGHO2_02_FULL_46_11]OGW85588.1 MAG: acetyltransferase [Omnitrophica bacterium RIFCSPLOWO2_01_FULL_45_10b]
MLFNSYIYIFYFLPISFVAYFFLNSRRLVLPAKCWLVFCSLFFYGYWNVRFLPLILSSILFNYAIGTILTKITAQKNLFSRKSVLYFGVACNLLLLVYFKYADFFISNLIFVTGLQFTFLKVALPLGISFYTFTQIAYLVDCYRSEVKECDLLNYGLFVTYFPHLIAGPILHHKDLIPQFNRIQNKVLNHRNIATGLYIFSIGLFKKVIIADTFSVWANNGFDHSVTLTFFNAWITALSYSFQLYFDFSGYIDMAIGSSLLFNINLPINFYSPYKAQNIQDFWRRWHITLSKFLRDYLYIPLGGNQRGELRIYFNLLLTFLLGGLWHGASWTFIFWGAFHGFAMVVHRLWVKANIKMSRMLAWFLTFNFVNMTWIFFRAKSWSDAGKVLRGMLGLNEISFLPTFASGLPFLNRFVAQFKDIEDLKKKMLFLILFGAVIFLAKNSVELQRDFKPNWKNAVFCLLLMAIGIISLTKVSEFIYFNF